MAVRPSGLGQVTPGVDAGDPLEPYPLVVGDGLCWSRANEEALREQQIRLFISYRSGDRRAVESFETELARALDRRGEPHDIWRDRWRIRAGEPSCGVTR